MYCYRHSQETWDIVYNTYTLIKEKQDICFPVFPGKDDIFREILLSTDNNGFMHFNANHIFVRHRDTIVNVINIFVICVSVFVFVTVQRKYLLATRVQCSGQHHPLSLSSVVVAVFVLIFLSVFVSTFVLVIASVQMKYLLA